jgi:hypothetical protein
VLQAVQEPPALPQEKTEAVWQTSFWQQPFGHEPGVQTQLPPTHAWPAWQNPLRPQRHCPPEQVSPRGPQGTHALPCWPHAVGDGTVQVLPLQQPLGQELALQTHMPPTQAWPAPQGPAEPHLQAPPVQLSPATPQSTHAPPTGPQAAVEIVVQLRPLQQPLGHDVASHTQMPPLHRWPVAHCGPLPQAHMPFVHWLATTLLQLPHTTPPMPHEPSDGVVQLLPVQQPFGHELGLQVHVPPTHT